MVVVTQIGSGSTLPHAECTCRWVAADRKGRSFADLEGFLHHVDDTLHPLDDIIGFGRVGLQLFAGAGGGVKSRRSLRGAVREVVAASMVEVAVKDPKQISMGLVRMSAMLAGKMTPDRAPMLHSEFPTSPTWRANC
jgi:hypothetical protein